MIGEFRHIAQDHTTNNIYNKLLLLHFMKLKLFLNYDTCNNTLEPLVSKKTKIKHTLKHKRNMLLAEILIFFKNLPFSM